MIIRDGKVMKSNVTNTIGMIIVLGVVLIIIALVIIAIAALIGWGLKLGGLMNFGIIQGFITSFPFL